MRDKEDTKQPGESDTAYMRRRFGEAQNEVDLDRIEGELCNKGYKYSTVSARKAERNKILKKGRSQDKSGRVGKSSGTVLTEGETMSDYQSDVPEGQSVLEDKPAVEEKPEAKQDEESEGEGAQTPPPEPMRMGFNQKEDVIFDEDNEPKGIPEKILGNGINVTVRLSLKTIGLYEIARTIQPSLSLGDYIDDVSEDFWLGRGKDLGLVELTGGSKKDGG